MTSCAACTQRIKEAKAPNNKSPRQRIGGKREAIAWLAALLPFAQGAASGAGRRRVLRGQMAPVCRARHTRGEYPMQLAERDFLPPELLADEEIFDILPVAESLDNGVAGLIACAARRAANGKGQPAMGGKESTMATKVITGKVRASFVHIFEPQSVNGSEPKYSCSFIIPKSDTETIGKIQAAIEEAKQNGVSKWGGKIPPNLKLPLRDGDIDRSDDPNYAGAYFVNANSNERPGVVDRRRVPITDPLEVYSGCYVRASITFYPFNTNGNRGIACGLQNIQKWCDGEPLNGRVRAEDEFDALDDVDDEDFLN